MNKYTGHESVQPFRAYKNDVEMGELSPFNRKNKARTEQTLKEFQGLLGGIGAGVTGVMVACEGMDETLRVALKFFREGVQMDGTPIDYRMEVVQFITILHALMEEEVAKS